MISLKTCGGSLGGLILVCAALLFVPVLLELRSSPPAGCLCDLDPLAILDPSDPLYEPSVLADALLGPLLTAP